MEAGKSKMAQKMTDIFVGADVPKSTVNKLEFAAKVMALIAEIEATEEVPADVFSEMPAEMRKPVLQVFCGLMMQSVA
jgi:hypothetical protein